MGSRILVTGFEPFGAFGENPSSHILPQVAAAPPPDTAISTRILPVSYRRAFTPVRQTIEQERPHAVVLLGLRAGAEGLEFERLGVNWRESTAPDNDGVVSAGEKIDVTGPAAYFSTLPIADLVDAAEGEGPAVGSGHAGTYVCNHTLYQTLRYCDRAGLNCRVGFVHVPLLARQALAAGKGQPSMPEDRLVAAVRTVIEHLAALPNPGRALP